MSPRFTARSTRHADEKRLYGLSFDAVMRHAVALAGGSILLATEGKNIVITDHFGDIIAESESHYVSRLEKEMFAAVEIGDIPTAKARALDLDRIAAANALSPKEEDLSLAA